MIILRLRHVQFAFILFVLSDGEVYRRTFLFKNY
jgi:hypothetical protein